MNELDFLSTFLFDAYDEKYYYYDYAKEFDLDLMGIKLVKGKLPTANGQLVLDEKNIE